MNDIQLFHAVIFFAGMFAGCLTVGFLLGERNPLVDLMDQGMFLVPAEHAEDSRLLDYLEANERNAFFNDEIDEGMWGVLDPENKLVAAGVTLRGAIRRAIEKENLGDQVEVAA